MNRKLNFLLPGTVYPHPILQKKKKGHRPRIFSQTSISQL